MAFTQRAGIRPDESSVYRSKPVFFEKPLIVVPILFAVQLFLVVMHLAATNAPPSLETLTVWFDLEGEGTIASWFASSQLLLSGVLLCIVGAYGVGERPPPLLYIVVGLGFVFLSMDEATKIHETLNVFTVKYDWAPRFEGGNGIWIFAYALVGLVLILAMRRSLYAAWLYQRTPAFLIALGFATMVAGAVFIEVLGYYGLLAKNLQVVTEELLEKFGGSLVLCGALILFTRAVRLDPKPSLRS